MTELHHSDQTLASDEYNSNMGDGTGNISRNLRPRQHMDKLSKYYILIKIKINGCIIKLQKFIFIWFYTSLLHDYICFVFLLYECFTVTAKQRIDSGFFLFQAEMKKKQEKKKKKIMTTRNRADSSDDEFM